MKKKTGAIIAVIVLVLAAAGFGVWWFFLRGDAGAAKAEGEVYVDKVSVITGADIALPEYYAGMVQAQKTLDVDPDTSRQIAEIFVEAGDEVRAGDPLFSYDLEQIDLELQSAQLEYEGIENEIAMYENQITEWQKQTKKDTPEYLLGLQDLQLKQRTAQYNLTLKANQIHQIEKSLENAVITSEIDGTVKSVNENWQQSYDGQTHFISILQSGNYHIECKVSELGMGGIYEGMEVQAVSRVDPTQTWPGVIEKIDRENPAQNEQQMWYGPESGSSATYYYFYVVLDSFEDLMLGQHVFVRPDYGIEQKEGLWLPLDFVVTEDDGRTYVWAEKNGRIEKRTIEAGEPDFDSWEIPVLSGLTEDDYIAFPDESVREGQKTIRYSDSIAGGR